jgi:hypothetical protein
MDLFPNRDHIEFLVRRQFRWFPPGRDGEVQFVSRGGAQKYPSIREAMKAYRTELLEKAPEEIRSMYEVEFAKEQEEQRVKAEQDEARRLFNQPDAKADISHWSKTPYWYLDEAAALSFGREPRLVKWENVKEYTEVSPFAYKYERLRDLILRAQATRQLDDPALPSFYIAWAKRNGIDFTDDLEAAVVAHGDQIGDWKSKYDEVSSRYEELLTLSERLAQQMQTNKQSHQSLQERIAELEGMLEAAPKPNMGLGGKERESVLRLIIGMAVCGYSYDPTASRSKVVTEIASDLTRAGVELSEDTVRKWLKQAAELLPRSERQ